MPSNLTPAEQMLYNEADITTQPLMHVDPKRVMSLIETIAQLRAKGEEEE